MLPIALVSLAAALVPPPITFRPDYKDKPLAEIVEEIEHRSRLMFISRRKPTGTITLKVERNVTAIELIQLLNDKLEDRKVGFSVRTVSFCYFEFDELFDFARDYGSTHHRQIRADELDLYHKLEFKQVILPLPKGADADETHTRLKKLLGKSGEISMFGTDKLLVMDQVKNLRAIRDALADPVKK